jgi:hypothetical protein
VLCGAALWLLSAAFGKNGPERVYGSAKRDGLAQYRQHRQT